tara:strand:- start:1592 stop:3115 length:1524 start_codon:yes stop_codon:yes gene_type:complete
MNIEINNKSLSLELLRNILTEDIAISLSKGTKEKITHSSKYVINKSEGNDSIYGINTGFGNLANVKIDKSDLNKLQRNLVSSHAVGVGELLPNKIVKLIIVLKIYALAQGYSGASSALVERLCEFINLELYPCIPSKGSVGASGDLAPLAHLSQALIGEGYVNYKGVKLSASKALAKSNLKPIELGPKEGLALLNGTQVSTAIALNAYFETENLFLSAIISGALTLEAIKGSITPFDERIHEARGQKGQIDVAKELTKLIDGSEILKSHANCDRIQDPYSVRCQPQVMGACLDSIRYIASILSIEANAVTDNPLVFADDNEIISGGNFHAEPVALVADQLAVAIAEMGSISERRSALLVDSNLSGLPPFLIKKSGLNSGFMIHQVTAAALVSENKLFAHPASVDSIPTSANQEDHVSMATHAAYRLMNMNENLSYILAIELLSASQGIEFHKPLKTSSLLQKALAEVRTFSEPIEDDRSLANEIEALSRALIQGHVFGQSYKIFNVQ